MSSKPKKQNYQASEAEKTQASVAKAEKDYFDQTYAPLLREHDHMNAPCDIGGVNRWLYDQKNARCHIWCVKHCVLYKKSAHCDNCFVKRWIHAQKSISVIFGMYRIQFMLKSVPSLIVLM